MTERRDPVEAGRWLKAERARLGASTTLVARLSTLLANRGGDPVTIHQQQVSDLEQAGEGRGPRTLRPWFRHVRAAFETGLIADALGREERPAPFPAADEDERYEIRDRKGQVVGELHWFATPRPGPPSRT